MTKLHHVDGIDNLPLFKWAGAQTVLQRPKWRVRRIADRHGLPIAQAAFYAREMRLPVGEVR